MRGIFRAGNRDPVKGIREGMIPFQVNPLNARASAPVRDQS
jgi:hypothetical protein